jgi:choline dehydrogenase-like flavoprotein
MNSKKIEILIIGAGASGAAVAWNLSRGESKNKFKITCLEQGPLIDKSSYSFYHNKWEIYKKNKFHINPNIRKLESDYPINDEDSPISISNFNAVGGSTILYSGHFPRFHPSDFKTKTLDYVGEDWPLNYKDLEPFYDINDKIMKVSGLQGDPAYPPIKHSYYPPIPLEPAGELIAKGFNKLGWHWWPSYSALFKEKKNQKNFIRSSVDICYWKEAINNGVKLKTKSRAIKIITNSKNKATGVIYVSNNKKENFLNADIIILACSGIGTPRILLNSKNKKFPKGLANSSGLVGKNLMLHPLGYVEGTFNKFLASFKGPSGCCIASKEFYETRKKEKFKRGFTMQVLRGPGPLETIMQIKKFNKLQFGKNFFREFLKSYGKTISLAIICEDLPERKNYLELDYKNRDSSGMPGVKIHYKLCDNTKKMLAFGILKAKEVLKIIGAKKILAFGPVRHAGWHIMGTTKMGMDKKKSVVNQFGQTHDIKNLVIVDSSIFVTSGGVNPMSTLQALALKISDNIKKYPEKYIL